MICRFGAVARRGDVVIAPEVITRETILTAVRENSSQEIQNTDTRGRSGCLTVRIECAEAGPIHDHIGLIHPEMGIRPRTALARAGRSRGLDTEYDEQIAAIRRELDSITVPETELDPQREAVAETESSVTELREAVAAARGRLETCREHDLETGAAEQELAENIRKLSEQQTTATAAGYNREQHREHLETVRETRERQFQLEDRLGNLERQARRSLVEQLEAEFTRAVEQVPGAEPESDPFACEPPVVALAIARIASLSAPLVLDCDRFDSPAAAGEWLGDPVIVLSESV